MADAPDPRTAPTGGGSTGLDEAIEAAEIAAARGWVDANIDIYGTGDESALAAAVQRVRKDRIIWSTVEAAVRAAAPLIEREALQHASDQQLLEEQARRGQRMPWDFTPAEYVEYRVVLARETMRDALLWAADELDRDRAHYPAAEAVFAMRWLRARAAAVGGQGEVDHD